MSLWLFGYGSLIWKTDFPYSKKLGGYILGYDRRFYQASTDHRGVPGKPGRVVTLLRSEDPLAKVYGIAYEIPEDERPDVERDLDFREKCGYSKVEIPFYPFDKESKTSNNVETTPIQVCTYIGLPNNEWYLGPASINDIAVQIANSQGPSGTNVEYLFQLANAVRNLAPEDFVDDHLYALERAVKDIIKDKEKQS